MHATKRFDIVPKSLAIVFVIAIFVPFSSSLASSKGIFCDTLHSSFEIGEVSALPLDTALVPVKFHTDSTLGGFANNILWNAEKASYVEVIPGTGLPQGWELDRVELLEPGNLEVGGHGDATTFTDDPVYWIKLVPSCYGYGDSVSIAFPPDPFCTGPNYYSYQDNQYVPRLVDGKIAFPNDPASTFKIGEVYGAIPVDDTTNVPVQLLTDSTVTYFRNKITWDAADLYLSEVIPGSGLPDGWVLTVEEATDSTVTLYGQGDPATFGAQPVYYLRFIAWCFGYGSSATISFTSPDSCGGENYYTSSGGNSYVPNLNNGRVWLESWTQFYVYSESVETLAGTDSIRFTVYLDFRTIPARGFTHYIRYDLDKFKLLTVEPAPLLSTGLFTWSTIPPDTIKIFYWYWWVDSLIIPPGSRDTLYTLIFEDTLYQDDVSMETEFINYPKSSFYSACEYHPVYHYGGWSMAIPPYTAQAKIGTITTPVDTIYRVPFLLKTDPGYVVNLYQFHIEYPGELTFAGIDSAPGYPLPDNASGKGQQTITMSYPEQGFTGPDVLTPIFYMKFSPNFPSVYPDTFPLSFYVWDCETDYLKNYAAGIDDPDNVIEVCPDEIDFTNGAIIIPTYEATAKIADIYPYDTETQYTVPFKMKSYPDYLVSSYQFYVRFPNDTLGFVGIEPVSGYPVPDTATFYDPNDSAYTWLKIYNPDPDTAFDVAEGSPQQIFKMKFERQFSLVAGTVIHLPFQFPDSCDFNFVQSFLPDTSVCAPELTLQSGSITIRHYSGPGPGCPYLCAWDKDKMVRDNTILAASEDERRGEKDVTDYYLLTKPLIAEGERYHLQIEEFERELTYLDYCELITVDHPTKGISIGVTTTGEIVGYEPESKLKLISCVDQDGKDHLKEVANRDGECFMSDASGYLILSFGGFSSKGGEQPCLLKKDVDPKEEANESQTASKGNGDPYSSVEILTRDKGWLKISNIPHRAEPCIGYSLIDLEKLNIGKELIVKIPWEGTYSADEIAFYPVDSNASLKINRLPLTAAYHLKQGEVLDELAKQDGEYATISPNESVELFFAAKESESGWAREFVFMSRGYYESSGRSGVEPYTELQPDRFELFPNYPNPFNPETNIGYSLAENVHVRLTIYNILGEKVRALVDEQQSAGYKVVDWDSRDDSGKTVTSGIYFYRLQAGDVVQTRKMVVIR